PGSVLTSMIKRVDVAAYNTLKDSKEGNFSAGVNILGIAEEGIDWAVDENNEPLLTADLKAAVEAAKAGIIAGDIKVHNYEDTSDCPF
ncbi:MAG: BMP family ABC transporter substrate-binding protein, partial [Pseudomonadota bacterium]